MTKRKAAMENGIWKSTSIIMMVVTGLFANGQAPGGVSTSLTGWFKANTTTATNLVLNGANVSQWKSETGNYTVAQTTANRQPAFVNTASTANLFNFNPSLQFQVSTLKSLNNTNATPDLLGTNGTAFLVVNTNNYNGNSSSCFAYTANNSNRYQVKAHFRIQTGNGGTGYTADFVPQFPTAYGDAAGRILTSSGTGTGFYANRNGERFAINNAQPLYNPSVNTGLCIGSNNNGGGGEYSNSAIAEVITYNTQLSDADANKVETYLAVKYGITLQSPATPVNYVASGGTTIWNATINTGYGNNITGIGRDDGTGLLQKQSLSVNNDRLVSLYNGNTAGTFPAMNTDNATTFAADQSFLLFGDNGQSLELGACMAGGKMPRMNRVWKVQQTGTNGPVTLAINAADVSLFIKHLVVSSNPSFPAGATTVYSLQTSGAQLYRFITLNNGEYFSFASDSLVATFAITQPTCANPASGIIVTSINTGTPFTSYSWNTTPVQTGMNAVGLGAGTYTFTATFPGSSCVAIFPAGTIQAAPSFALSVSASPVSICQGGSSTLVATIAGGGTGTPSYQWAPGGQSTPFITVTPTDTTKYYLTVNYGACSRTDSVMVNVKPKPTATFTALPATICLGDTSTITYTGNAAANATYNWNGFAGATVLSGSSAGPYKIKFAAAGAYVIQLQVAQNGCAADPGNQTVTVQAPPTVSFTAASTSICSGDTVAVNFTGNAPAASTYNWNWGGGIVISGTNAGPYGVRYTSNGTINLSVTSGMCTVAAPTQPITILQRTVAQFSLSDSTGCDTLLVRFTNASQNGTAWLWNLGDGTTSTAAIPTPKGYGVGTYPVTLTVTNGQCSATSAPQIIRVIAGPVADFTSTPVANLPLQLSNAVFNFTNQSTGASRYQWSFGDNNTSTSTSPVHTYNAVGSYAVTLIAYNTLGCADTLVQSPYLIVADSLLRIPNAFSPNGDGINDTWVIAGLRGYPNSKMNVFNRWGQLVYSSTGYTTSWDGNYNGKALPIGTYYYTIIANSKSYTGPITILR